MENMFLGVILLCAHFLTVLTAPIVPEQNGCAEGEPLVGESQPDVNLTVLPSQAIPVLNPIAIICDADVARFPLASSTGPPTAPVRIMIHVGIYKVKECEDDGVNPVYQCVYDLRSFFPGLPRRLSCTAVTADGQCRFKAANITLLPAPPVVTTRQQQANMTTVSPSTTPGNEPFPSNRTTLVFKNGTNVSTTAAPQGNVTTAIPTVPITNVSTSTNTPQNNVTTAVPTVPITNVSTLTNTPQNNITTAVPTVPITNATTAPPSENVTTTSLPPAPPTPTGDGDSTTRTPVVSTTEQVIPPIPTTTPTPKKDDDDSEDESEDDSEDDSEDESEDSEDDD